MHIYVLGEDKRDVLIRASARQKNATGFRRRFFNVDEVFCLVAQVGVLLWRNEAGSLIYYLQAL